ncbi:unnamed protein product, partial [Gadus morhua 'NCC']
MSVEEPDPKAKRSNFAASSVTRHTVMCEKHFTPDSYNQGDLMESRLGFRRREWVRLANGAVPSVHAGLPATSGGTESSTSRESARRKRELCTIVGESAAINDAAGATPTSEPEDDGDGDTSTMDPEPVVVHRGSQCNIRCFHRSLEDCDDFGDCSTQRDATSESLYAPGSSHMSSHNEELRILNVYGKGEGPLALDGHDTLVSELEALNSLSADHSVVKSLERGEQLVRREELTGQQTPDTISIKDEEDIDGGMPALEDCDDFGDCSTQHSAALDSLHVDAPGSSHMSGHKGELRILNVYGKGEGPLALDGNDALFTASKLETLNSLSADHREELTVQQTPDTISIKEEEDIDGGMPAGEDCNDFGDRSTQRGATSDGLHVDAPGSSHMSSHSEELRILSVYGKGEGPLALHGHDALFTASKPEALSSLSTEHSVVKSLERGERLVRREELTGQQTPDTISIKEEVDIDGGMHAGEDCNDFGDRSTQRGATSDSLHVDAPGSSHMSSHSEELRILSVYGKGEGPLALHGHDALFTASEPEALSSLSTEHSVVKSLERGERLVRPEELTGQQTPDTISIKEEVDIDGGMPAVEDCDDFGDRSTQRGATSDSLHVDAPGSSHMSSHSEELRILSVYGKGEGPLALHGHDALFTASEPEALSSLSTEHSVVKSLERGERLVRREELTGQQTLDTISIKEEVDIDGDMHAGEDCDDFGDCSTQHSSTLDSLHVEAPGSSHLSSHNGELRILRVYGKGEGPLAVDGHDNPFTVFKPEVLSSLSAEHSMAKNLQRGEQLVHREELTGHRGDGKDQPGVLSCEDFPNNTNMINHMRTHTGEKPHQGGGLWLLMGDTKDTWKVKTLEEILQEKKRRRELEEKTEPKRQKNFAPCPVPQVDDREAKRDTPEEGELRDQRMEITIQNSPYTREGSTEDRGEEDDSLAIKPPQQMARKDKSHHRKEDKRKDKRRHRSHSDEGDAKHPRPKDKDKDRESERRKRLWEEDKARRDWERQKRREQARAHSRRERADGGWEGVCRTPDWMTVSPLDHRDRLEQLERQRERDRKIREQQQKEQRDLKERERRAEERRKEREMRREGPSQHRALPEEYEDKAKQSHRSRSPSRATRDRPDLSEARKPGVSKEEKPEDKDPLADLQDISGSERKTSTAESSAGSGSGSEDEDGEEDEGSSSQSDEEDDDDEEEDNGEAESASASGRSEAPSA